MGYNLKSIKEDFKRKGVFYTPPELAAYMRSFFPFEIKEIYDPTCGDGALLAGFGIDTKKYGQDINEEQIEVASSNLYNFIGIAGDTLKKPAFTDKKFDYIIANPPFSIKWEPNKEDARFKVAPAIAPKSKADYAFLLHIIHSMSDKGYAVVMNFPGVLYRGNSEGEIRQWIVEQNLIEKIIHVPGDKFIDTKISTCIIILNKRKTTTNILFQDGENEIEKLVTFAEIKENNFNLSVSQYCIKEIKKEYINPIILELDARGNLIRKLKAELEFSKKICELENMDFKEVLKDVEKLIKEQKASLNMIKDKDNFTCNKMYSSICSTNLAGQKNCDCCDCFYNKCDNCSYTNTGMCIKCKFQKEGDKTD